MLGVTFYHQICLRLRTHCIRDEHEHDIEFEVHDSKKIPKLLMLRRLSDVQRPSLPEEMSRTMFFKAWDVQFTPALAIAILNCMEIDAECDDSSNVALTTSAPEVLSLLPRKKTDVVLQFSSQHGNEEQMDKCCR